MDRKPGLPNRVPPDVSVMMKPAKSFAHLRSGHQHLLRADSIRGPTVAEYAPRRGKSKARAAREARNVSRVMCKHFPGLLDMLPQPSPQDESVHEWDSSAELGSPPRLSTLKEGRKKKKPARTRKGGTRRSRTRRSPGGSSTLSQSGSRLFDPRLTASAMDEIQWLPRFRESISRATASGAGNKGKNKPGNFDTGRLSGTLGSTRGPKNPLPHPDSRPPFIPSGGAAAKKGVMSDNHTFLNVGTEYDSLRRQRLAQEQERRAKFLAGRFRGTNKTEASKLVAVRSYLNSPDEEALDLEKQWIREKTLLATSEFARKRVGRAKGKTKRRRRRDMQLSASAPALRQQAFSAEAGAPAMEAEMDAQMAAPPSPIHAVM